MSPDLTTTDLLRQHPFPTRERCGDAHEASPASTPLVPRPAVSAKEAGEVCLSRYSFERRRRNYATGFTTW